MRFKNSTQLIVLVAWLAMTQSLYANAIKIVGALEQTLQQPHTMSAAVKGKVIQLLHVELSDEAKQRLANRAKDATKHTNQFSAYADNNQFFPNTMQLNMNKVPVLDQGAHGTCVTFAVTGALDALIGRGDYISQVCNLQLGSYLELFNDGLSGWEGSYASTVIDQIEQYGIINTANQRQLGCGGLKEYPTLADPAPGSYITPGEFLSRNEPIFGAIANWSDVFVEDSATRTLEEVKESLYSNDRLIFAVLFPRFDLGFVGALGKHKTKNTMDTWVITPEIMGGLKNIEAAHEMIITGYDDNAVAIDNHGKKHKGLLTLRNSWGTSYGDSGTFYMSYDYFKLLTFDLTRFTATTKSLRR